MLSKPKVNFILSLFGFTLHLSFKFADYLIQLQISFQKFFKVLKTFGFFIDKTLIYFYTYDFPEHFTCIEVTSNNKSKSMGKHTPKSNIILSKNR